MLTVKLVDRYAIANYRITTQYLIPSFVHKLISAQDVFFMHVVTTSGEIVKASDVRLSAKEDGGISYVH